MRENDLFDRLKQIIEGHQSFIITTHLIPDGDGLGGEIALATYIRELGKDCVIINSDPTPEKFSLVDPDNDIQVWQTDMVIPPAEIIFAVDVNEEGRVGGHLNLLKKTEAKLIFIDHHIMDDSIKGQHIIDFVSAPYSLG